jgi:hypothetical protein
MDKHRLSAAVVRWAPAAGILGLQPLGAAYGCSEKKKAGISPYFQIVKPGLTEQFNYRLMDWIDRPRADIGGLKETLPNNVHRLMKPKSILTWE